MSPIWYDAGGFKLYFYSREQHRLPHVAVMAGRLRLATVEVETGEILAGSLSTQQHRRIRKLLAEHTAEALLPLRPPGGRSRSLDWTANLGRVTKHEQDRC